ncbi:MAG TPA: glycosyltransferase family 87 protein [Myxococcota bacterium]|nr:glycosyltransferase family 87 protein [Myxococcota bacterium]
MGWAAAAVILAVAFAVSPNFKWTDAPRVGPYAGDFLQEYTGGRIALAGDRARLYDPDYFAQLQHDPAVVGFAWPSDTSFPPIYPPFYYLWVAPLSRLDYHTAARLWTALSVAALVAGVGLLADRDRSARAQLGAWVAASLCYAPVMETFLSGQKGTFLLAIFAGAYRLLVRQRPALAGALFGCAAFKPQLVPVIALAMLAKRQWRFLAGMAATGAVLAAQSLWVGWRPTLAWIAEALHPAPQPELIARSHSWIGFARLLLGAWSGPAVLALALALVAATLALLARGLRGPLDSAHARFPIQFAAMVVATALASPHLYTYDLTILVIPLYLAAREMPSAPPATAAQRWMWLGTLLAVFVLGGASSAIAERIPLQVGAVAGLALLFVLALAPGVQSELAPAG